MDKVWHYLCQGCWCHLNTHSQDIVLDKNIHQMEKLASIYVFYEVSVCPISYTHTYACCWVILITSRWDSGCLKAITPGWICIPSLPLPFSLLYRSIDIQSSWQMLQSPGIKNEPEVMDRLHCEGNNFLNGPTYCKWHQTTIKYTVNWERLKRFNVGSAFRNSCLRTY